MLPGRVHHFGGLLFVSFPILHYINLQVEMSYTRLFRVLLVLPTRLVLPTLSIALYTH